MTIVLFFITVPNLKQLILLKEPEHILQWMMSTGIIAGIPDSR